MCSISMYIKPEQMLLCQNLVKSSGAYFEFHLKPLHFEKNHYVVIKGDIDAINYFSEHWYRLTQLNVKETFRKKSLWLKFKHLFH